MAKSAVKPADRAPALAGFRFANDHVAMHIAPPASRTNLRATEKGAKAFEKKLGLTLPRAPSGAVASGGKLAFWLGPDEWLLVDEKNANTSMVPKAASNEFSAVDISHRNVAFVIDGPGAANMLNAACPRDLSLKAFPVGTCSRTIFGKAEVVLYRKAKNTFRMECWRSFAPYVRDYLLEGARDAHI
ncbi:MAG: sarcosine oxidase subunit gamma [Pseudomonadota bacterium]